MSKATSPEGPDLSAIARDLKADLGLTAPPVQISYMATPPHGAVPVSNSLPSVCSFFAAGGTRNLIAPRSAHGECEIGAYVMGISPEGALGGRLSSTVSWMEEKGYLAPGEAAHIPHNATAPEFVGYGPLGSLPTPPTVVMMFVRPRALMLVVEAAARAWPGSPAPPLLSRPMCSFVPVLLGGAHVVISVGCSGSRVYTEMGDDTMLVGIRADALRRFAKAVHEIRKSNDQVWDLNLERKLAARSMAGSPAGSGRSPSPS